MGVEQLNNEEVLEGFNSELKIAEKNPDDFNLNNTKDIVENPIKGPIILEKGKRIQFDSGEDMNKFMTKKLFERIGDINPDNLDKKGKKILEKLKKGQISFNPQYNGKPILNIAGGYIELRIIKNGKIKESFAFNFNRENPVITYFNSNDGRGLPLNANNVNSIFE